MSKIMVALASGILFGAGLALSQMTNPSKVLDFLDIAGNWDPSLILVMVGALVITFLCFKKILKHPAPLFDHSFYLSSKSAIDKPLIIGATLFGMGWGISGYCLGPAVAGLGFGNVEAVVMVIFIYMGFMVHCLFEK